MNCTDLIPPSDEEILNMDFIGIHEAAFWINGWPKEGDSEYYPDPTKSFDPKQYGSKFLFVYEDLEKAVKYQWLSTKQKNSIPGILNYVRPHEVLLWALGRHFLPSRLQALLNLHLLDNSIGACSKREIVNRIIFQCILAEHPLFTSLEDYLKHPWIEKHGEASYYKDDSEHKAMKRHLQKAIGFKATRGTNKSKSKLVIIPIQDILCIENNIPRYNIKAFCALINILCRIKVDQINANPEKFSEITPEKFMESICTHQVVSPYVNKAPQILLEKVRSICLRYVWQSSIAYVPKSTFKEISVHVSSIPSDLHFW